MKVIIAPDSFKETLSAIDVASAIEEGIKKVYPDSHCVKIPMADGGEGTAQVLSDALNASVYTVTVRLAHGKKGTASFSYVKSKNLAIIESATAIGLDKVPLSKRNPMETSSYGLGELIKAAYSHGARTLLIGLGGSATVDGGIGMAEALGIRFTDKYGKRVPTNGSGLERIHSIDTSGFCIGNDAVFIIASDVKNPLLGEKGAACFFGPQKGATEAMIRTLENGMKHYAEVLFRQCIKRKKNIIDFEGAGAAGGLGAALSVFCRGRIQSGIDMVLTYVGFEENLEGAHLIITGEGKLDGQSIYGKVPFGVLHKAKKHGVPVIIIAGALGQGAEKMYDHGAMAVFSATLQSTKNIKEIQQHAYSNLVFTTESCMRIWKYNDS